MSLPTRALALSVVVQLISLPALASSFNEVRGRVYAAPLSTLPKEPGVTPWTLMQAVVTHTGALVDRLKGTLSDSSDFKPSASKLLHPMGICAEADWNIESISPATGLLAQGTSAKAIVRFSAATEQTTYSPKKARIFGMAVKLFPSGNDDESVETSNIFTLDQNGLDGGTRKSFLANEGDEITFFENQAPGGGLVGKIGNDLFALFDSNPTRRPLYPLTEVTDSGASVSAPATPELIRFVPEVEGPLAHVAFDFRDELRGYEAGRLRFAIVLPPQSGDVALTTSLRIGTLVVGTPVLSTVCDRELHFRHHPTR